MSNIISAVFAPGETETVAQEKLYQWSYGQILLIEGLELQASYQVDFSNFEFCGCESIPMIGSAQGVQIPNELLRSGKNVYAFVWVLDATGGRTQYRVTIPVTPRPAPDLPDTPPTPDWTAQVELALAEAVEKSEEALAKASAVEEEGARQVQAVQAAGDAATEAVGSAQTVAVQAVQTESTAQQAAVQAKGEEVLASIPEDYTELSGNVSNLKSLTLEADADTIEQITGNRPLTWYPGRYKTATTAGIGTLTSFDPNAEFVYAKVPCSEGDQFSVRVYGSNGICRGFFFCDANMICLTRMAGTNTEIDTVITAPEGAAWLILNNRLSGLASGFYGYAGDVPIRYAQASVDALADNVTRAFSGFVQKNVNSSTGAITNTGAENNVVNEALLPIDAVYSATSDGNNIILFCYAEDGSYLGNIIWKFPHYLSAQRSMVLAAHPGTAQLRIRFGDSGDPVHLEDLESRGIGIRVFESGGGSGGYVTRDMLAQYEDDSGAFSPSGSEALTISLTVPFNGDYSNQIFTAVAKFEQAAGVADVARIRFMTGSGLNGSTWYTLGGNGHFETKQWRVVRYPGDETAVTVTITVPGGVTLYIQDFYNEYTDLIERMSRGIRINSHRKFPNTPNDTIPGLMMAVKSGANAMIEIPKRLSDGVWICYHDDSLTYNDTYIRQADGSELPSTYDHTLWSSIDFETANSWDWGISTNARFAGVKPMTLEQFFTICGKTGIKPMLSIHPFDAEHLPEVRELARRCGVLADLGIKCTAANMPTAYAIFSNEVESYTLDITSGATTQATVQSAINTMAGLTGCTVRRVIELFASTAYAAYFGETQFDPFGLISAAGFGCSIAQQTGRYQPTHDGSSVLIWEADMDWWRQKGVNEYTFEYHTSFGLNW